MLCISGDEPVRDDATGPKRGRDRMAPAKIGGGNAQGGGMSHGDAPWQFEDRDHWADPVLTVASVIAAVGGTIEPSPSSTDAGIVRQRWLAA